jgi:hypothetical protein
MADTRRAPHRNTPAVLHGFRWRDTGKRGVFELHHAACKCARDKKREEWGVVAPSVEAAIHGMLDGSDSVATVMPCVGMALYGLAAPTA